jgi:hypothetical protein
MIFAGSLDAFIRLLPNVSRFRSVGTPNMKLFSDRRGATASWQETCRA